MTPELPIIVVTAQRELENGGRGHVQAGAYDYVTKPLDRDRLLLAVHRANERRELLSNVRRLESARPERAVLGSIVGKSPPMRELAQQVQRVLESDVAVCVLRRIRHWQRAGRARDSHRQRAAAWTVRRHQLRGHSRVVARVGAVRSRARRVYGRYPDAHRG